jgi:hypothetical protein
MDLLQHVDDQTLKDIGIASAGFKSAKELLEASTESSREVKKNERGGSDEALLRPDYGQLP